MMESINCEITTRGYELDPSSLIPPVIFFRYMEHMRWVSAERGAMDLMQLLSQGYLLVVAGQQLIMHRQVGMGVRLEASMRFSRAGRTSLTLAQAFQEGDDLVARGQVAAVLLDPAGAPAPLPEELRALAGSDPAPELCPALEGSCPRDAWRWAVTVRPSDLDLYKHANQSSFLAYVDDARILGVERGELTREAGGRLRKVNLEYRKQVFLGDDLIVHIWLLEDGAVGAEIMRGKEVVSRARVEV